MCSCLSKLVLDLSFKFSVHMEDNARRIPDNGSNIVLKKTYCYKVSTQNGFDLLVFEWLAIDFPTKNQLKIVFTRMAYHTRIYLYFYIIF